MYVYHRDLRVGTVKTVFLSVVDIEHCCSPRSMRSEIFYELHERRNADSIVGHTWRS